MAQKKVPLFVCNECGKKFFTVRAAEKAAWNGCPQCGGGDIDIAPTWTRNSAEMFSK